MQEMSDYMIRNGMLNIEWYSLNLKAPIAEDKNAVVQLHIAC